MYLFNIDIVIAGINIYVDTYSYTYYLKYLM